MTTREIVPFPGRTMYNWMLEKVAFPLLTMGTRSQFWPIYHDMMQLEQTPRAAVRKLQSERLRRLLRHAYETVPYYKRRWDQAGAGPDSVTEAADLARLPVLRKADIQRAFPDQITTHGEDRSDWRYASTRGTTEQLMAIHDFARRDVMRASGVRTHRLAGYRVGEVSVEIPPNICNIVCGEEGQELESVLRHVTRMVAQRRWKEETQIRELRGLLQRNWMYRRRTYPPFDAATGSHPGEEALTRYIARLRDDRPAMLKSLPTYLLQIARHIQRNDLPPLPVKMYKTMGGSVSRAMRTLLEPAFAGRYREDYGTAEFGDLACDCERRDGLHVLEDLFIVEVVRGDRQVAPGEFGKIIVTDLTNLTMPFVRYQIGDVGRYLTYDCPCGRPGALLSVEGRLQDTVVTDAGLAVTSDAFMDFFYARDDVDDFQLTETSPARFDLLLVPAPGRQPDIAAIRAGLSQLLDQRVTVDCIIGTRIRPEGSGKFRFVKSCTHARLDAVTAALPAVAHA